MNKRIDFTKLGGALFYQDTFEFMQDSYFDSLNQLAQFVGEKYVISGCVEAGANVGDGEIVVDGERMKFIGGANTGIVIVETIIAQEGFDDSTLKDFFYTKQARFGNTGGFNYSDLKRLPLSATSIGDCVSNLFKMIQNIIQFEPTVILQGCDVTNVNTIASTADISAGLVLFAGKLISTPAYSGAYPAYLKEDGGWTNIVPGAGLYIIFDPYTSQRYVNVLDRSLTPTGKINMYETLSDRFVAGVGKWEMKGYQLMSALQNRVPVGLWYDGVPEGNVSDAINQTVGNKSGEKNHTLTIPELPVVTPEIADGGWSGDYGGSGKFTVGGDSTEGPKPPMKSFGGGQSHNNMQPYTVIVYAKRI